MSERSLPNRSSALALLVVLAAACAATAQDGRSNLEAVAFMSGCWEGTFQSRKGAGVIEERYTDPSENVMLGTTRYMVDGRTTQFELTVIRLSDDGGVLLTPYPGGERSEHSFRMTETGSGRAVFEAPEHDFPKRIIYERAGDDGLRATIDDGGEGSNAASWEMKHCRQTLGR